VKTLSLDLRERILASYDNLEGTRQETADRAFPGGIRTHQDSILARLTVCPRRTPRHTIMIPNRQLIFGFQGNKSQKGIVDRASSCLVERNAERGMIALRVQDPTARHEEASNDNTVLRRLAREKEILAFARSENDRSGSHTCAQWTRNRAVRRAGESRGGSCGARGCGR
jgi:hypothetical protein